MVTNNLLKKVLHSLETVQASTRDTAEPSVREQLDEAISDIQQLIEDGDSDEDARSEALACLGRVFDKMPSIVSIVKLFSG